MSYESTSHFPQGTKLALVNETIALLGYKKCNDDLDVPNRVGSYMWYDEQDYKSWTGVELDVYQEAKNGISVTTRSRASRSYWDLTHQNKTLKYLRDLFGGHFTTDAGRNRYWRPDAPPPAPIASGCYLARWRFHNNLIKARIYLTHRKFDGSMAKEEPTGLMWLDDMNPRLLSNNLLLPYVVAVWEDYFRSTFVAALKYSTQREGALKRARLTHAHIDQVATGLVSTEQAVASTLSFQRPSVISENFRLLDQKIDISAALRRPYRRRKTSLHDSIETLVESRNAFVHAGRMKLDLFDKQLNSVFEDMTAAVDRAYDCVAKHYRFTAIHDY